MKKQILAALATYGRTAASAVLGAYIAGQTNPKLLGSLALSSIAAPLFRALNPNDASYGTKKSA